MLLTLEERTELSRTFAKNRSVDDTQHGHITASGERGQMEVAKSNEFLDTHILQKTSLYIVQATGA